jgi:hypothetical protein
LDGSNNILIFATVEVEAIPVLTSSQCPKITKKQTSSKSFLQKLIPVGDNILAVFLSRGVSRPRRSFQAAFTYFWAIAYDF